MPTHRLQLRRLERLGRWSARHAKVSVAVWAAALVACFGLALGLFGTPSLFDRLTSGQPSVPGPDRTGRDLLAANPTSGPQALVLVRGVDPAATTTTADAATLAAALGRVDGVQSVLAPGASGVPAAQTRALLADDGRGLAVVASLRTGLDTAAQLAAVARVRDVATSSALARAPGASVQVASSPRLVDEITGQVEVDLRRGEGVALPVSLVVMVLVFGGFVAAGLPLLGAVASIGGALAALLAFTTFLDLDATVVNVVTILGLGLCIDYGLLLVSRFREELRGLAADRPDRPDEPTPADVVTAVGRTVAVAGRTVLFSGLIVALSLCGLLVFQASILRAIGAAGVSVVVVALLVALTFVPALLALAGRRLVRPGALTRVPGLRRLLQRLGDVAPAHGVFSRLARRVQCRPVVVTVAVVLVLLAAGVPALGMRLRSSGIDLLPPGAEQRDAFDALRAHWPDLDAPDVQLVARAAPARLGALATRVQALDGVARVRPVTAQGPVSVLGVDVDGGDPGGPTATEVVHELRDLRSAQTGVATSVVGQASAQLDFVDALQRRAPAAVALVVVAASVLLFLLTGSVLVPLKALVMNVVSLGASLGVLTLVFQHGWLHGLLHFTPTGGIETSIPPLVLSFAFGLAMDYEVFLLSRIKEAHDGGMASQDAVAQGLQRSGRIITSAALLVVIVFAGLAAARLLVVQQTGVALVLAVAVDATVVRMLLVPSTMTLLGDWNWWAPGPLRRLHARVGVREH